MAIPARPPHALVHRLPVVAEQGDRVVQTVLRLMVRLWCRLVDEQFGIRVARKLPHGAHVHDPVVQWDEQGGRELPRQPALVEMDAAAREHQVPRPDYIGRLVDVRGDAPAHFKRDRHPIF